jgi:protein gp37
VTTKPARRGTGISWTDETWNPTVGCSRVSPGCVNCYAEHSAAMVNRTQGKKSVYSKLLRVVDGDPRWNGVVNLVPERLDQPLRWKRPRRIFVNSMSDLFHEALSNEDIAAVFGAMAAAPGHTYQVLTKRAKRMRAWFAWVVRAAQESNNGVGMTVAAFCFCHAQRRSFEGPTDTLFTAGDVVDRGIGAAWPLPNVWLGVSTENQEAADDRIPELLETPAAVRFISAEPLLGDTTIWAYLKGALRDESLAKLGGSSLPGLDWVIVGCESGAGARPCDVAWLRAIRDQCLAAGVALFLKQAVERWDGVWPETPECGRHWLVQEGDGSKRKPGGIIELPYLDGVQHAAFPQAHVAA